MDIIIDFILNIDKHMVEIVHQYHLWTYAILFLIIFCETGLVVTPFLPGDSLLFVTGAIAALPGSPLNIHLLVLIVFAAAFLGALIGFLWYNSYPAQVFMGDTGSLAIGGLIGVFAPLMPKEVPQSVPWGGFLVGNPSGMGPGGFFRY